MTTALSREVYNKKISLENQYNKKMLKIHKAVFNDIMKNNNNNMLAYKSAYKKILANINQSINLVDNKTLYNDLFLEESANNLISSLQKFHDAELTNLEKSALLPIKSKKDTQYAVQQNYENQNLINQLSDSNNQETAIMASVAANEAIQSNKVKTWVAILDMKTRQHHANADGQTVGINDYFLVGGDKMNRPGDSSLGAGLANVINCRCTVVVKDS